MEYTLEQLKQQYKESKEGDEVVEITPRIYEYRNEGIRRDLLAKANKLLPEEKQLAILLHGKLCNNNHTGECSWGSEIHELERDWSTGMHAIYLEKATEMLKITDFETAKKLVACI